MAESLVVHSKVKDAVKSAGCNCASEFPDALSDKVAWMVKEAAKRAQANGRKTVRKEDL